MSALVTLGFFYTLFAVGCFTAALVVCCVVGYETIMRRYRIGERQELEEWLKKANEANNSTKRLQLPG